MTDIMNLKTPKDLPDPNSLIDELHSSVEISLGYAHITDGVPPDWTHKQLFDAVRGSLFHCERAARRIRKFLKKYREL